MFTMVSKPCVICHSFLSNFLRLPTPSQFFSEFLKHSKLFSALRFDTVPSLRNTVPSHFVCLDAAYMLGMILAITASGWPSLIIFSRFLSVIL